MKLLITEEHLKRGRRNSIRQCPIALALAEKLRPEYSCSVGCGVLHIYRRAPDHTLSRIYSEMHPRGVMDFIQSFDHGPGNMEPVELLMPDLPAHFMR